MIIALGYRVQSQVATRFRRWATLRLHEYIQKGFAMDDERLKQGGNRYFRELLQRIRDIRSSERTPRKRFRPRDKKTEREINVEHVCAVIAVLAVLKTAITAETARKI